MTEVRGVVLAAGAGSRLGTPKAGVRLGGELLPLRVARVLREGGCSDVTVVLGCEAAAVRAALADEPAEPVRVVEAPDWAEGLSASVRAGVAAGRGHVLVALADQPGITPALVARLLAAHAEGTHPAVVAAFDGRARNPVLLDASVCDAVAAAATGDSGARGWLRANPALVRTVECADVGTPDDIDTPDDLDRAHAIHSQEMPR